MHRTKYKLGIELINIGLIGLLTTILWPNFMWDALRIILGVLILLWGVISLNYFFTQCNLHEENRYISLIKGILYVAFGILLIIPFKKMMIIFIICLIIALNLIIPCIFRLIKSHMKKEQFFIDIYQYITSLFILLIPFVRIRTIVSYVLFGLIFILGIILTVKGNKENHKQIKEEEITGVTYDVEDK